MENFGIEIYEQEQGIILPTQEDLSRYNSILYFNELDREIEEENREWKRKRKTKNSNWRDWHGEGKINIQ